MRNREEKKCKKGQESTIGKIIYGFLLFMPLLAILVTCSYAMFNKNAYKSYYGVDINNYELDVVTELSDLQTGNKYKFRSTNITESLTNSNNQRIYFSELSNISTSQDFNTSILSTADSFYYSYYSSNYVVFCEGNTELGAFNISTYALNFEFIYEDNTYVNNNFNYVSDTLYRFVYMDTSFISEAFYYSVDKVEQSNLFNWAQNSVIYTTTNATCNALNINNTFIPLLLSYWLIISVLYFLYDIALMLVWIVHRKIHDLQENF